MVLHLAEDFGTSAALGIASDFNWKLSARFYRAIQTPFLRRSVPSGNLF